MYKCNKGHRLSKSGKGVYWDYQCGHFQYTQRGMEKRGHKLTYSDAEAIRLQLNGGCKAKDLAQQYGVTAAYIRRIRNGVAWSEREPIDSSNTGPRKPG